MAIALILFLSALVRLGGGTGSAIALEISALGDRISDDKEEILDISPELVALLDQTRERAAQLDLREAEIEARHQALMLVEQAVNDDIARLEDAEAKLRSTIAVANSAAESDLTQLTSVYENMKSEQAAELFERMEPSFAAGFLGRMRADTAAAILAGLEPDLAYSISVVLAGRNADVPREPLAPEGPESRAE